MYLAEWHLLVQPWHLCRMMNAATGRLQVCKVQAVKAAVASQCTVLGQR